MVDARARRLRHHALRAIGDAETRFPDHRKVVRTVAHGKRLVRLQAQFVAQAQQRVELRLPPQDRFGDAPGELPVDKDQAVRLVRVEADGMGNALREEGEAAGDQGAECPSERIVATSSRAPGMKVMRSR